MGCSASAQADAAPPKKQEEAPPKQQGKPEESAKAAAPLPPPVQPAAAEPPAAKAEEKSEPEAKVQPSAGSQPSHGLVAEVLIRQDDKTSEAVIELLSGSAEFKKLSISEGNDIVRRDNEDEMKLVVGVQFAIDKSVLPAKPDVAPVKKISVAGKAAEQVADEILHALPSDKSTSNVLILQGLSGTGKGTTVKILQQKLPNCVCWSNGNAFRVLTHLASEHCTASNIPFTADALTKELLASLVQRMSFEKFDDGFDVVIDGSTRVSAIQNTLLKQPHISSRVPSVASLTQGEVVGFASHAVKTLQANGFNVILEGRAQTLNYIPSPNRFELVIENMEILGQRRAAQRVMAAALESLGGAGGCVGKSADDVKHAVLAAVSTLAQ